MKMANIIACVRILESAASPQVQEIVDIIRNDAWESFEELMHQNEGELTDYIDDYEDETGEDIVLPPGRRRHERGVELEDPAFKAWLQERIASDADAIAANYVGLIENDRIRAWRAIEETPGWDASKETRPHIHWSYTREKAQPIFGGGEAGHIVHLIEALIPVTSINWAATVRANLSREYGEDEDEIVVVEGAPFEIISVTQRDAANA